MFLWLKDIKVTVKPPVRHKYDGNHARRVSPPPFWYWVCMATLAAILLGVCIHAAAMDYARDIPVRGEYADENDRAMEEYWIEVINDPR